MKLLMLMGAILGFSVGCGVSLLQQSPWPNVVWHACLAAYASGMLLRWWGRTWERNLRLSLAEKHAAAVRASASPTPSTPPPNLPKR